MYAYKKINFAFSFMQFCSTYVLKPIFLFITANNDYVLQQQKNKCMLISKKSFFNERFFLSFYLISKKSCVLGSLYIVYRMTKKYSDKCKCL